MVSPVHFSLHALFFKIHCFNEVPILAILNKIIHFIPTILKLIQGIMNNFIIAVMCSEKDPLRCHRFHSISKELKLEGILVNHILEDGSAVQL